MTMFGDHVFASVLMITGVSFGATFLRNWIKDEGLSRLDLAATAVFCAFVALLLTMLADAAGLRRWYWAEILFPVVYTAIGSPRFLLGESRHRATTANREES